MPALGMTALLCCLYNKDSTRLPALRSWLPARRPTAALQQLASPGAPPTPTPA